MSSSDNKMFDSINPSNGKIVWTGKEADPAQLNEIFASAHAAQKDWSSSPMADKENLLVAYAAIVEQRSDDIASAISEEIGKPFWEAKTEVSAVSNKISISIKAHKERCSDIENAIGKTRFKPHGVVAVYGPFNFPAHLPNGHICPALLAGNAVIFKPSELAPKVADLLAECWKDAGLPEGLLQVVHGGRQIAQALSQHHRLNGLFFTGSEQVGRILEKQFASNPGKILALELGGNNPLLANATNISDLEAASLLIIQSAFLSAGQRCTCARRLVVPENYRGDELIDLLVKKTAQLTQGDPFSSPAPFMGPVVSSDAANAVMSFEERALNEGAKTLLKAVRGDPKSGFVSPSIIDSTDWTERPDEECFGPLLQIIRTPDFPSAIEEADNTRFGLAAGLLSDKKQDYEAFFNSVKAGIINWNQQLTGASSGASFGGIGASGNFRPSAYLAADYTSYAVASIEIDSVKMPASLPPGLS